KIAERISIIAFELSGHNDSSIGSDECMVHMPGRKTHADGLNSEFRCLGRHRCIRPDHEESGNDSAQLHMSFPARFGELFSPRTAIQYCSTTEQWLHRNR